MGACSPGAYATEHGWTMAGREGWSLVSNGNLELTVIDANTALADDNFLQDFSMSSYI